MADTWNVLTVLRLAQMCVKSSIMLDFLLITYYWIQHKRLRTVRTEQLHNIDTKYVVYVVHDWNQYLEIKPFFH